MKIKKILTNIFWSRVSFGFAENVVKFFFLNPATFLFVKRLDRCLYLKYLEFNQKINGNGFIAMTFILDEKSNTASNMIINRHC